MLALERDINIQLNMMANNLKNYVDHGRIKDIPPLRERETGHHNISQSNFVPLQKVDYSSNGAFSIKNIKISSLDCSTIPLMRADNWGVYLFRLAHVTLDPPEKVEVDWGYEDLIIDVVGNRFNRRERLREIRLELESKKALEKVVDELDSGDYLFLDGPSYFGGIHRFSIELYDKCEKKGIKLLMISKNSPSLVDPTGKCLLATLSFSSPYPIWAYTDIKKADRHENLFGNVNAIKLCPNEPYVFRCDTMEYLIEDKKSLFSPLTALANDPRSPGYPIALYLAHDFTRIKSKAPLLYYRDLIEDKLRDIDILDDLLTEEVLNNFRARVFYNKKSYEEEGFGVV